MKPLSLQTPCPCCAQAMQPAALHCAACELRVEGSIRTNEFTALPPEELHLLRVFVWAEGRIRDMEGPLGLSYPTIRTRLASLKAKLQMEHTPKATQADPVAATLDALESGDLDFTQAIELIKKRKGRK